MFSLLGVEGKKRARQEMEDMDSEDPRMLKLGRDEKKEGLQKIQARPAVRLCENQ